MGKSASVTYCVLAVTIYTYVVAVFMVFFITTSLQFDANRVYMKGLIDELDDSIEQPCTAATAAAVDHDEDDVNLKTMLQHIVCFHVSGRE